ncbi:ABC transporter permease [Amycolatopsis cihanbeyliensis]|uniref:Transport permease protein n=1 Tax=Amycolatopsis cihanbeyliensis TaxID=1128664 RepID=A0A542DMK7_AMYCI|nr:ABC transporter permease [Amycolatopsis cihanbeyliensis]TQJ04309.1 ABC-2 type transport system permease protein [Amycolatopsis cihanbeyliensis]
MTAVPVARDIPTVQPNLLGALADRSRPAPPSRSTATLTFSWRALLHVKHSPEQLIDVIATPASMMLLFNFLFGGAIAGSTEQYLQYLLPGVLVQLVTLMSVYTGVSLNTDLATGIFDRFRTLPIWQPANLVGKLSGDVLRFVISMTVTIGLGLALGFRPAAGVGGVLLAAVLLLVFAFSVGWIFTTLGLLLNKPESISGTSMLVVFPLVFLSNIFVLPASLPGWLRAFVEVNPISHAATAVRGLMHGTATAGQLLLVLASCAALTLVFGALTMRLYRRQR